MMLGVIGIVMTMGLVKLPELSNHWCTGAFHDFTLVRQCMPREFVFLIYTRFFHMTPAGQAARGEAGFESLTASVEGRTCGCVFGKLKVSASSAALNLRSTHTTCHVICRRVCNDRVYSSIMFVFVSALYTIKRVFLVHSSAQNIDMPECSRPKTGTNLVTRIVCAIIFTI